MTISLEDEDNEQALDIQKIMGKNVSDFIHTQLGKYKRDSIGSKSNLVKRNGEISDNSDLQQMEIRIKDDTKINSLMQRCYAFDELYFKKNGVSQKDIYFSIIEKSAKEDTLKAVENIGLKYQAFKRGKRTSWDILNYRTREMDARSRYEVSYLSETKMFEYEDNVTGAPGSDYKDRLRMSEDFIEFSYSLLRDSDEYDTEMIINKLCSWCVSHANDSNKSVKTYLEFNKDFKSRRTHILEVNPAMETSLTKEESELLNSSLIQDDEQYVLTNSGIQRLNILIDAISAVEELRKILGEHGYSLCDLPLTYYMKNKEMCNSISTVSGFLTSQYYKDNVDYEIYFKSRYRTIDEIKLQFNDTLLEDQYVINPSTFVDLSADTGQHIQYTPSGNDVTITPLDKNIFKISEVCDIAMLSILELVYPETLDSTNYRINMEEDLFDKLEDEFARNCRVESLKTILGILVLMYRYLNCNITAVTIKENNAGTWVNKYTADMTSNKRYWYTFNERKIEQLYNEFDITPEDLYFKDDSCELYYRDGNTEMKLTEFIIRALEASNVVCRDTVYRNFLKQH
jgi:hypothetical protein